MIAPVSSDALVMCAYRRVVTRNNILLVGCEGVKMGGEAHNRKKKEWKDGVP